MNDVLDLTLPPYGAVVLELADEPADSIWELPGNTHTIDVFTDGEGNPFSYPEHGTYEELSLSARAVFLPELKQVLESCHGKNDAYLMQKIETWHEEGMPFTFVSALRHRLALYIPFEGPRLPESVKLYINEAEVPVEVFCLNKIPVFHYAFVEEYVKWGEENQIRLQIRDLAENSFLGIYVNYPDLCEGMTTETVVFPERARNSNLYSDPTLVIESLEVTPDVFSDKGTRFAVTVKTAVEPERIEGIYYIHPTNPEMNSLRYDPDTGLWRGESGTGYRPLSIFCNSEIKAWIRTKDGGVGPRKTYKIKYCYK